MTFRKRRTASSATQRACCAEFHALSGISSTLSCPGSSGSFTGWMRPPCVNSFDASPPKKATQLIALERARLAPATTAACAPGSLSSGSCTRSGLSTDRLQAASAPSTTSALARTAKPRRERSRRISIRMVVLPPSEGELEREGHRRRRRQLICDQREELVHVVARADQLRVERGELAVRPAPEIVE